MSFTRHCWLEYGGELSHCALHVRASYKLISLSQLLALTIVAVGVKAKVKNVETELLDLTSAGRLFHIRETLKWIAFMP